MPIILTLMLALLGLVLYRFTRGAVSLYTSTIELYSIVASSCSSLLIFSAAMVYRHTLNLCHI